MAVDKENGVVANGEVADVVSGYELVNGSHGVPMKT